MRKLAVLLTCLLLPTCLSAATLKGYEIGRIYKDGKITVVDVTYWEYEVKVKTITQSGIVPKSILKQALATEGKLLLDNSAEVLVKVLDNAIADSVEIKIKNTFSYAYNEKKGIIGKESLTYKGTASDKEIYGWLNDRLLLLLPAVKIIPECRLVVKEIIFVTEPIEEGVIP